MQIALIPITAERHSHCIDAAGLIDWLFDWQPVHLIGPFNLALYCCEVANSGRDSGKDKRHSHP